MNLTEPQLRVMREALFLEQRRLEEALKNVGQILNMISHDITSLMQEELKIQAALLPADKSDTDK